MKTKIGFFGAALIFILALSCNDDPEVKPTPEEPVVSDFLSDALVQELDEVPTVEFDLGDILLPNGMTIAEFDDELANGRVSENEDGPQRVKNKIIKSMQEKAKFLMDRSLHKHDKDETTPNSPEQFGLAYASGNKDYTKRETPGPSEGLTYENVFGLDCSGFLFECTKGSLDNIKEGRVANQVDTAMWNNAIRKKYPSDCSKVRMVNQGYLPISELMTGDIIYWLEDKDNHIGFIGETSGHTKMLFNSHGATGFGCSGGKKIDAACLKLETEKNRSLNRGPRSLDMLLATNKASKFWGTKYKVLRLVTEIEGSWKLTVRCTGQATDAIEAMINITSEKESNGIIPIAAEGTGTDYNGSPINFVIGGAYNSTTNILKASITMTFPDSPGDMRKDGFEVKLLKDDTGYIPATQEVPNGGCSVDFRLINNGCGDEGGRISLLRGHSEGIRGL